MTEGPPHPLDGGLDRAQSAHAVQTLYGVQRRVCHSIAYPGVGKGGMSALPSTAIAVQDVDHPVRVSSAADHPTGTGPSGR